MPLNSARLTLERMSHDDFELFVRDMLTDPRVVEHYQAYRGLFDLQQIRVRADKDFWQHFEASRKKYGCEIWSIFDGTQAPTNEGFVGWAGLVHSSLSDEYGAPELQYMLTSRVFGLGYATEAAQAVMTDVQQRQLTPKVIATVDIANQKSIRVLEKLGFDFVGQIDAYNSSEMFLYSYKVSA